MGAHLKSPAFGARCVAATLWAAGIDHQAPQSSVPAVLHVAFVNFYVFSALKFISIAQAASISFIAPLIVVLLAGPLLGEKVTLTRVVAVLVGFLGVLIVIRPGTSVFQWASLLIVGSASCYAIYQLLTRKVAGIDLPETSVVYSALVGSVILSLIVPWFWTDPANWIDVLLLCSLGALS